MSAPLFERVRRGIDQVLARSLRAALLRSRLPYGITRRAAAVLIGNRRSTRPIHNFRMELRLRDVLQSRLLIDGVWEPPMTRWWAYFSARSAVALDVGAHCGYYSLFAAAADPGVHVHAFEPNPVVRDDLERNVALNAMGSRITVVDSAVTARTEPTTIFVRDVEPAAGSLRPMALADRELTVASTSLDDHRVAHGITVADLCKIDIEGAESQAVTGMAAGLAEHAYRVLLVEVHTLFMGGTGGLDLYRTFAEAGYVVYRIDGENEAVRLDDPGAALPDFDQWIVLTPEADQELAPIRDGHRLVLPDSYQDIFRGVAWSPAGLL